MDSRQEQSPRVSGGAHMSSRAKTSRAVSPRSRPRIVWRGQILASSGGAKGNTPDARSTAVVTTGLTLRCSTATLVEALPPDETTTSQPSFRVSSGPPRYPDTVMPWMGPTLTILQ